MSQRKNRRCPHCDLASTQYYRSTTHDWRCLRCGKIDSDPSPRPLKRVAVKCTICGDYLVVEGRKLRCSEHGPDGVPFRLKEEE